MNIKVRLAILGKMQKDLLDEVRKRGFPKMTASRFSAFLRRHDVGPTSEKVMNLVYDILDEWEKETE